MKIGFLDSGMGGLTVLEMAMKRYPATYLYYADTENVPYGKKSKKQIKKYVNKAVSFLIDQDIDLLVIACNTATSVAIKDLRAKYDLPIVGMEPAIKPAARIANKKKKGSRILVCATKMTLKEDKLKNLISDVNADDKVELLSLQKLVTYTESKAIESNKPRKYLLKKFSKFDWSKISVLVLGCTHFIFFKDLIRELIPDHVQIVDGNEGTVNRMMYLAGKIKTKSSIHKNSCKYFQSDIAVNSDNFRYWSDLLKN